MMVSVDLFEQCSDRVRSNNIAVFPVRLNVNEDRGGYQFQKRRNYLQSNCQIIIIAIIFFLIQQNILLLVEEVRQDVQLNWPDAETGVAVEDQNRACSVLSSYVDNGNPFLLALLLQPRDVIQEYIFSQTYNNVFEYMTYENHRKLGNGISNASD